LKTVVFVVGTVLCCYTRHCINGILLADIADGSENKMNVLINEFSRMNAAIVEYLASRTDVSIYLSVSQEDTLRIVRDVKPEVIIFCRSYAVGSSFVKELSNQYAETGIYLCEVGSNSSNLELINYRNYQSIDLNALVS
jgi:hypothetical protein